MKSQKNIFAGAWQTEDEDSRAIFLISEEGGSLLVRAFDDRDGEEFVVSNVRIESGALHFETFIKSSKYRARHVLRCVSSGYVMQELTIFEKWKRMPDAGLRKLLKKHGVKAPADGTGN